MNQALFELCDDVTVGWLVVYMCIVLLHVLVIHFALSEFTFSDGFVSINYCKLVLFISVQPNTYK